MTEVEIALKLGEYDTRLDAIEKNIESLSEAQKENSKLIIDVHDLASSIKMLCETVKDHETRISKVEEIPAENWRNLTKTILSCAVTSIVTAIITAVVTTLM